MARGVGHGHQIDKVFDHKLDVAVGIVKWLSWVRKLLLVLHIQFWKMNNDHFGGPLGFHTCVDKIVAE